MTLFFSNEKNDFSLKISKGVFWVPMCAAGRPEYSEKDLRSMEKISPEEKQVRLKNLCDAINYLYVNQFYDKEERIDVFKAGDVTKWEYHKTGFEAIKDNWGCCSSCASGLLYLLDKDYDCSGYIHFIRPDMSGHIITWFKKENQYYIVDPSTYIEPYVTFSVKETGLVKDFVKRRYFTNGLYLVLNLESYIQYFHRYLLKSGVDFFFLLYPYKYGRSAPISAIRKNGFIEISLPEGYDINVWNGNSELYQINWKKAPI